MRSLWVWPTVNLLATLITGVIVSIAPATPLQPYVVMSFVCFCPGMALVRFLRLHDLAIELSLAVALSLSVASIAAGALLYAKHWSPVNTLTTLVLLTLTCSIAQLIMQLPIVGIATTQKQSDDIAESETMALAALKGKVGEQQEVVKASTPQPPSRVRKAAWGLEEAATTVIPATANQRPIQSIGQGATSKSHKKEIEQAATTILPAVAHAQTQHSVAEKDTTLLTAVSSSPAMQKIEEKDTTLLAAVSSSPGSQKIEEKDTTLLPSAKPQSVKKKDAALSSAPIETQNTQVLHKEERVSPVTEPPETPKIEEKKATPPPSVGRPPETPKIEKAMATPPTSVTKPPETPAIVEKKASGPAPLTKSQQPPEGKEKEHADKKPGVQAQQQKAENRDRDTDAEIESNSEEPTSPGETPNSLPALSSPVRAKPLLKKSRLSGE